MRKVVIVLIFVSIAFTAINDVHYWGYQLQMLDETGAVDGLVDSWYDMLIIEPTNTEEGMEWFDTADMVARCKASAGTILDNKLVIAYIDIGEAEEWRYYWQSWWVAPEPGITGVPDFLVAADPDGWEGNYPVAYWDSRWKDIIINNENSMLKKAIADGFDGIYMDWVEAYDDTRVMERAVADGVDAPSEMIQFIREIRDTARRYNPDFLVIAQNAADLCDGHPEYYDIIDAIAQEDFHFLGEADVDWGNPLAGDIEQDSEYHDYLREKLDSYLANGLPVFTCEYALDIDNILYCYRVDDSLGYVPFVSQTPLSRLPDYTPDGYHIKEKPTQEIINRLIVFPNPAVGIIHINLPKSISHLGIYDIDGRQIKKFEYSRSTSLDWPIPKDIKPGVYSLVGYENGKPSLYTKVYILQ